VAGSNDHSGDAAVQREVEDLAAVIEHVGGKAGVFGHSSGGTLALEGVLRGLPIDRLAIYEMPVAGGDNSPSPHPTFRPAQGTDRGGRPRGCDRVVPHRAGRAFRQRC
jgi:pimeloyl-ACP methyl ester carboxylesterase